MNHQPVTPWDNPRFKRHPQVLYPDQLGERVDLSMFAEQHQIDPDEGYRDAVFAEITDGLIWLGWGAGAALLLVVGVLYFGGAF